MARRDAFAPTEARAIELLKRALGASARGRRIEIGIGDDAAVLLPGSERLVFTIDACIEGVHFDRRWLELADVGFRALMAAASDLAAMAARPLAAVSNLGVPSGIGERELSQLARGQAAAAAAIGCPVAGGNLSRAGVLSITTAVLGESPRPLLRSDARPGDELWLIGALGLSAAGLALLRSRRGLRARARGRVTARTRALRRCVASWQRPRALIQAGLELGRRANAAIDVSDGLGTDARHIAVSSGVRVVVEALELLRAAAPELTVAAAELGRDPLDLMVEGGEDYALLASGGRTRRPRRARRIGRVERGSGAWLERGGELVPLLAGFDHLR